MTECLDRFVSPHPGPALAVSDQFSSFRTSFQCFKVNRAKTYILDQQTLLEFLKLSSTIEHSCKDNIQQFILIWCNISLMVQ